MSPKDVKAAFVSNLPQQYEAEHVHSIYEQIAPHFSSTRYKPWPIITQFLNSLEPGFVGLDSGTGNGKYLSIGKARMVGSDRSRSLLEIARQSGDGFHEVVLSDVLYSIWRTNVFDFAISIATIHHLATHERRCLAVQRLLESVSLDHGRILIYVWAIDQDSLSKRKVLSDRKDVSETSRGKDVFVPWVLSSSSNSSNGESKVFDRYYHMFAKNELQSLVCEAAARLEYFIGSRGSRENVSKGVEIIKSGWERSNYYVELLCWRDNTYSSGR